MNARHLVVAAALAAFSTSAFGHGFSKGDIAIGHPWTRATPGGATVGAGYLKITNSGKAEDTLVGGTFDGADKVEVHEMTMSGGTMTMRHLSDGLIVKPGETIELKPSSFHLMFLGLSKPIALGPDVKGTLVFKNAGSIDVEYRVEGVGATESQDHKH